MLKGKLDKTVSEIGCTIADRHGHEVSVGEISVSAGRITVRDLGSGRVRVYLKITADQAAELQAALTKKGSAANFVIR